MNNMKKQPLVAIIIACYNQENFIKDTIESVKNQTFTDYECIIVDDGSTDKSLSIIQNCILNDDRFKVFHKNNEGICMTRNYGISKSSAKYILPLDGDDKIASEYIEKAVQYLENDDTIKIVYCKAEKFGAERGLFHLPKFNMETMLVNNCIFNCAFFRKTDFDLTCGYNSNMKDGLEDWDFWLSILELGTNVVCIDEVLFYYRIKNSSRNSVFNGESELKYRLYKQIWENHKSLYSTYFPNPLATIDYTTIKLSYAYKLGQCICRPVRFIRNFLNNVYSLYSHR